MGGGSGTFQGHAIPSFCFFTFGIFFLVLTFQRCRALNHDNGHDPPPSFCDLHIPERNTLLLRRASIIIMVGTALGTFYEGLGGYLDSLDGVGKSGMFGMSGVFGWFRQLSHEALYLCIFFVGAIAWLESYRRLPPDSSRVALSFAFFLQYLLWNEHGLMKKGSDARVHILQAQINLAASVAFGYSVYHPRSMVAYLSGWGVMVLNALWMFTAGLTVCCIELRMDVVGAVLVLEALLVAAGIAMGAAVCAGPVQGLSYESYENGGSGDACSYRTVATSVPEDESDDWKLDSDS